jgi:hypothetical protein
MTMSVEGWLDGYREAWVRRDPAAAAALFTEDATYQEEPYAAPFVGRDAIAGYWSEVTATQSDIEVHYGTPLVVGNRVAVEWWTTLTNAGAEVTLAGSFMLRFAPDGRCAELREYWHAGGGRREPSADWGR